MKGSPYFAPKRVEINFGFTSYFAKMFSLVVNYRLPEVWKILCQKPVSVDLRVSRIYRHLAASPSFAGQIARAGGTPRLSYLPFQTMEMPLDGDNTKDS